MQPVEIRASGMVTGVGLTAPSACAAIRAGIARFTETRFMFDGEWLPGCEVPLEKPWRGREKLLRMATMAVGECLSASEYPLGQDVPIIVCLPELSRPGRIEGLDERFLGHLRDRLGLGPSPIRPGLINLGRPSVAYGIHEAGKLLAKGAPACVIAGVDTILTGATLAAYHNQERLKTEENSNGFIPGEAASAILVAPPRRDGQKKLLCLGVGMGAEPAPIDSEEPLRAEGLFQAIREAMRVGNCSFNDVDFRITDVNGEHYGFKEASLALTRTMRILKERFEIWHPVECIGEVGAAIGPLILGVALSAARRGYGHGPGVLCHFSSDGADRAAMILRTL